MFPGTVKGTDRRNIYPAPFRGKAAAADTSVERKYFDVTRVTPRRRTTAVTGRGSQTQISIKDCAEIFTKITDFFGTQRKVRLVRTSLCHKINIPLHRRDAAKSSKGRWLPLSASEIIFSPSLCDAISLCACVRVCVCVFISALTKWRNFFKKNKIIQQLIARVKKKRPSSALLRGSSCFTEALAPLEDLQLG